MGRPPDKRSGLPGQKAAPEEPVAAHLEGPVEAPRKPQLPALVGKDVRTKRPLEIRAITTYQLWLSRDDGIYSICLRSGQFRHPYSQATPSPSASFGSPPKAGYGWTGREADPGPGSLGQEWS